MTSACRCEEGRPSRWRLCWIDGTGDTGILGLPDSQAWYFIQLQLWVETSQSPGPPGVESVLESHQGSAVFVERLPPPRVSISLGAFLKAELIRGNYRNSEIAPKLFALPV